ncbi:MAG: sporulation integral membrane protein YlbJ [Firmicutes bacterium]|nr:sporulation integral membrane protein YlbJ [Bacillota bacterium]
MPNIIFILSICLILFIYYSLKPTIKKYLLQAFLITIILWLTFVIILFPEEIVNASLSGLKIWFFTVFPSLLPFFIVAEILLSLGIVNFIGALLKPLMRPLFNVPGEGSFAFAMSITSGYPVGAKLVAKLRKSNTVSKTEAERLVAFCSTSGPLFMIGAVAVGMLNNPKLGALIAISHYLGAVFVGLLFRFYKRNNGNKKLYDNNTNLIDSFKDLIKGKFKKNKSLGLIMGDAVKEAISTMLLIGGFIIFYSVVIKVLSLTNVFNFISDFFPNTNPDIVKGLLSGLIEMTNGCQIVSSMHINDYLIKVLIISFLIGWSGLSIHSQVISFISKTDISIKIYVFSKALHGIFAVIFTYFLYFFKYKNVIVKPTIYNTQNYIYSKDWISYFSFSFKIIIIILLLIIFIGIIGNYILYKCNKKIKAS